MLRSWGGAEDVGGDGIVLLRGGNAGKVLAQAVGLDVPEPEQGPGCASYLAREETVPVSGAVGQSRRIDSMILVRLRR